MTVNTEDIYRAMGKTPCEIVSPDLELWHAPDSAPCSAWEGDPSEGCNEDSDRLPDPLTDWSAFGEILEWADREGFAWYKEFDVWVVRHHDGRCGEGDGPEREARLAALSEAVRE